MKKLFLIVLLFVSLQSFSARKNESFFIENKGQWPQEVLFLTQLNGLNAWITKTGVVYDLYTLKETENKISKSGQVIALKHVNAQEQHLVSSDALDKQAAYYNFFIGNNYQTWASGVCLYKEAIVKDIYQGVDIRYYFDKSSLRYDYIVNPGADPSQIEINPIGSEKYFINNQGELVLLSRFGEVKQTELYTYQMTDRKKTTVTSSFILNNQTIKFSIGNYDKTKSLIIDPLVWSTYIGGSGVGDGGYAIAIDSNQDVYVLGETSSSDYPTTTGAYDVVLGGSKDLVVSKLNSSGSSLIYSTFIGGGSTEGYGSIAVDNSGNVFISGQTSSANFPTTAGAYDQTQNGSSDAFVVKLNSSGNALIYSTFIGGSSSDNSNSIAIDANGNAYITGSTNSSGFPTTSGAYDQTHNSGSDAYVAKIDPNGAALVFSTFIGGNANELSYDIALDPSNAVYIAGTTKSSNFPTTSGAYNTSIGSNPLYFYAFVTKLNPNGTNIDFSTFIGGNNGDDEAKSIAIHTTGVYIGGKTLSSAFPTTTGAFDASIGGVQDGFVSKLSLNLSILMFSTYIGGIGTDYINGLSITAAGEAVLTGYTGSNDFPVTAGCFDATQNFIDAFVTKLNSSGSSLMYSTYLGGNANDEGFGIALDNVENAIITGNAISNDFPTTTGAYDITFNGGSFGDVFVTKINLSASTGIMGFNTNDCYVIYPNPANNFISIRINDTFSEAQLTISDINGRTVYSSAITTKQTVINTNSLVNGVYFLQLSTADGNLATKKLIITK